MASIIDKPNKPNNWWTPPPEPKKQTLPTLPEPKPATKKVLAQPVKPQMPPPTLPVPGQYPQMPKSNIPYSDYYGWDDVWGDIGNWLRNIGKGGAPYQPPTLEDYQQLSGEKPAYRNTLPHGNTLGAPDSYMLAAAAEQTPSRPNYSYYYPVSGIPKNWDISPIAGATRANIPYNPQQEYYAYSPERDAGLINSEIAWAKQNRAKNTAQDYFDRIVINGRTYSVPNQALNFASDYPWETTSWWYEPPADFKGSPLWKEKYADSGVYSDDSPPSGGDGGGGGGGGWGGGYGSGNYSSKPAYPMQGYQQDPAIFYQQLVKWVI